MTNMRSLGSLLWLDSLNYWIARAESVAHRAPTEDYTEADLAWYRRPLVG